MGLGARATLYVKIHEGVLIAFKDGTNTRITAESAHAHHADLVSRRQGNGLGPPICRPKATAAKSPSVTQAAE
jgi:hypothetical protein